MFRARCPTWSQGNFRTKIRDVLDNDRFGGGDLLAAQRQRLLGDRLQRIDIVKINALYFVYVRIDIARHRYVDDKQRPVEAVAQHWLEISGRSNGLSDE